MLSLRRPSDATVREFLAAQSKLGFTYAAVGATATCPPRVMRWITPGSSWERARRSSRGPRPPWGDGSSSAWAGWRRGHPRPRSETGEVVAVVARGLGLWWLNACRIVYVVDEPGPVSRYRVRLRDAPGSRRDGRGAVPRRMGPGERGGLVRHPGLLPPALFLTRLGYPYMRRVQKRFGRESAAAMVRAVKDGTG